MFTGSLVALITPLDERGRVDRASLQKLIDYHVAAGTSAIVAVGTTGESATLSHAEHIDVVRMTVEMAAGRIPVIAGAGANATAEAVALTEQLADSGVVACLSVTPYYNKPGQEGLYQHFKTIAQSTDLPQILYNVPSRTGCDLLPETVARLAEIWNIVAIKEASGDLRRVSQIQSLVDASFVLLSGDDASGADFMQLGGQGIISVTANIAAHAMAELCALAAQGQYAQARVLNQRLMPLHQALFVEANPVPVKWACHRLGMIASPTLRLPLTPLSAAGQQRVEHALIQANLPEFRESE